RRHRQSDDEEQEDRQISGGNACQGRTPTGEIWRGSSPAGCRSQPSGALSERPRDQLVQFAVQLAVAGQVFAALKAAVGTAIIGDETARFLDQQQARGRVPDVEIVFPEAVKATGRDPGEVKRR